MLIIPAVQFTTRYCPEGHGQVGTCFTFSSPHCLACCSWKSSWRPWGAEVPVEWKELQEAAKARAQE